MQKLCKYLLFNAIVFILIALSNCTVENFSLQALQDVIFEIFIRRGLFFEIVFFGEFSKNTSRPFSEVIRRLSGNQTILISNYDTFCPKQIKSSALFFVDSDSNTNLTEITFTRLHPGFMKFLFVFEDESVDLMPFQINPGRESGRVVQYSYFLLKSQRDLELKTFEWWTEKACNTPQLVTLNTFKADSEDWQKPLEIHDKFLNFHNCTIKSLSNTFVLPVLDVSKKEGYVFINQFGVKVLAKREVLEVRLVNIIAECGNFTPQRALLHDFGYRIGFAFSCVQDLQQEDFVMHHESVFTKLFNVTCNYAFHQQTLVTMYSPPDPYTNYEKMVMPFDVDTWMYIGITFLAAFIIIFFINFLPKRFRDVIYGERVTSPTLNTIGTFFGYVWILHHIICITFT